MNIDILHEEQGAASAQGVTVIIDVFRAFTLEAYLFHNGVEKIYATGEKETAYALKKEHPEYILIGERHGKILPGFDYGNSPSAIEHLDMHGKTAVHTTSNGTQGIKDAVHASAILTGALVNARATADYIESMNPKHVSLVCMGWEGKDTEEDQLCADYLKSLLEHQPMKDIDKKASDLRYSEGKKFFDPSQQDVFPQADFNLCIARNIFDFAIQAEKENNLTVMHAVPVKNI